MYKCDLFLKLIEEVKKYEVIYNVLHPERQKRSKTQQLWSVIASNVGDPVQRCKTRWKSLRDRYEQEYASMTSDNAADGYKCDWKYMNAMAFMEGYVNQQNNFLVSLSKMTKRDIFCRACLRPVVNSPEEFYDIFVTENFVEKFVQCTNIKSDPWDKYPHLVCEECYEHVLDFHKFQVMCRDSLQKFNVMLEDETEVKCELNEEKEVSESLLNGDTSQLNENPTAAVGGIKCVDEMLENQKQIEPENEVEDKYAADPLAGCSVETTPEDREVSEEIQISNEVPKKRKTGRNKAVRVETNKKKIKTLNNQLEEAFNEDAVNRKIPKVKAELKKEELESADDMNDDDDHDYDLKLEDLSDDDKSFSDDSETTVLKGRNRRVPLKCDLCPKVFYFPHRLEAHQRRHKGLSGYPCTFDNCPRGFNRLRDLREHLNTHNGIPNDYKCDIDNCNAVFPAYAPLNVHKRKVHKCGKEIMTYPCETCGKVLTSPRSLKGHRYIHVDKCEWPYSCDEKGCTVKFRFLNQKKIHLKRHAGIKNYVCPHCGMRKTTSTELNIHINFHTFERKYPCHICSKVFKSVGTVSTHIHVVHEGKLKKKNLIEKGGGFKCRFCERILTTKLIRKQHESIHTGEARSECDECGKTFGSPAYLKQHKAMHMIGENPYVCVECGRTFKREMNLKAHMQTHSEGGNPHTCDICSKEFQWASSLNAHKKLHVEGAVPYTCEICGQGFRWPGSYYGHRKKHLGQKIEDTEGRKGAIEQRDLVQ